MRSDGAVTHLRRSDRQTIASIRQETHLGAGTVLGRWPAFEHGERHSSALHPFLAFGLRHTAPALQRGFHEIDALVEPVAAEIDVRRLAPDRFDPVVGTDQIAAADLKRIKLELFRQVVDRAFDREGGLRGAVATEAAGRDHIGIDSVAVGLLVRAAIGGERAGKRRGQRLTAVAAIGAGVRHDPDLDRRERAVAARA